MIKICVFIFFMVLSVNILKTSSQQYNTNKPQYNILKYLPPDEGNGYDLFYYDGHTLRDEKWRFDPNIGSPVYSRRDGFLEANKFHLVDAITDALGSLTKTYGIESNFHDLIQNRVRVPQFTATHQLRNVDFNQYYQQTPQYQQNYQQIPQYQQNYQQNSQQYQPNSPQNQQNYYNPNQQYLNVQNNFATNNPNGFNFHQVIDTPNFGFQQGITFNVESGSNLPSQPENQLVPQQPENQLPPQQPEQIAPLPTTTTQPTTSAPLPALAPLTTTTTTNPIYDIDIRFDNDDKSKVSAGSAEPTEKKRPVIEGLPTADEDDDDENEDNRIGGNVLKTLVG